MSASLHSARRIISLPSGSSNATSARANRPNFSRGRWGVFTCPLVVIFIEV